MFHQIAEMKYSQPVDTRKLALDLAISESEAVSFLRASEGVN